MKIQKHYYPSIEQVQSSYNNKFPKHITPERQQSFDKILEKEKTLQQALKFSKHANERLTSRSIELSQDQMERLQDGVNKAKSKGIKESLVLMDDIAFVVNVPNRTVITAMEQEKTEEQIFTNIDGAVII
jgi:flagellar operon protein